MKWKNLMIFYLLFSSCVGSIGAGTLGGWRIIIFPVPKQQFDIALDNLYVNYNRYKIPQKWKYESEFWKRGGYDFLQSFFVYFEKGPEEMYYITYVGTGFGDKNPSYARIAIRAVYTERNGWKKNKDYSGEEKTRIEKRFNDEIISKLEVNTKAKSYSEK